MDATPEFVYEIVHNPEPEKMDTIELCSTFIRPPDLEPILTRSSFYCSSPTTEFIEDDESPHKRELFNFFTKSGVDDEEAAMLIVKLIDFVLEVTSSVIYCARYALSIWVNFDVVPRCQESVSIDDQRLFEEAVLASYEDYENAKLKPTSKLGVGSLSKRTFKRATRAKRRATRAISVSGHQIKQKACSLPDRCTICLNDFKSGQILVRLPCGHEFDDNCILTWLKVNHVCPLCRQELPCEEGYDVDDDLPQTTTVF